MSGSVLVFHSGPLSGKGTKIKQDVSVIGRSSTCDITVLDPSISREHAKIINEGGRWFIKDLGSQNGLKLRGKKVNEIELTHGLKFLLGKLEVEFINAMMPATVEEAEVAAENSDFIDTPPSGSPSVKKTETDDYDKRDADEINKLKHKRVQNILILLFVLVSIGLLAYFAVIVLNQKERPLQKMYVRMNTNSEYIVDLFFIPISKNEALLKPFKVSDYNLIEMKSDVFRLGEDIQIDEKSQNPNMTIVLKSTSKSGSCEIFFYKLKGEERQLIGLLSVDVERRQIPLAIKDYINSDLETKIKIATHIQIETQKIKNDPTKKEEIWNNLKMAKQLFEYGDVKPEIYNEIEKEYYELVRDTARMTGSYWSTFEVSKRVRKWDECLYALDNIIALNPDPENIENQKASILRRRVRLSY